MLSPTCPLTKKDQLWTVLHYKCKYDGPCWGLCGEQGCRCSYFGTNDPPKMTEWKILEYRYMGQRIKIQGEKINDT